MRRILIENARRKLRVKRGGRQRQELDAEAVAAPEPDEDLLALDAALHKMAELDAQKVKLIELRYFGGLTCDQAAAVLGISPSGPAPRLDSTLRGVASAGDRVLRPLLTGRDVKGQTGEPMLRCLRHRASPRPAVAPPSSPPPPFKGVGEAHQAPLASPTTTNGHPCCSASAAATPPIRKNRLSRPKVRHSAMTFPSSTS